MNPKHPPGPPMTLGNMRAQGVQHLIAFCLHDACRHLALIRATQMTWRVPSFALGEISVWYVMSITADSPAGVLLCRSEAPGALGRHL